MGVPVLFKCVTILRAEYKPALPLLSTENGLEVLNLRIRNQHVEGDDYQSVFGRGSKNGSIIADDARQRFAAFQMFHDLPNRQIARIRVERIDGLAPISRYPHVAGIEQAIQPRRARTASVLFVVKGSEKTPDESVRTITKERNHSDDPAGKHRVHRGSFSLGGLRLRNTRRSFSSLILPRNTIGGQGQEEPGIGCIGHPRELGIAEIARFLDHLAWTEKYSIRCLEETRAAAAHFTGASVEGAAAASRELHHGRRTGIRTLFGSENGPDTCSAPAASGGRGLCADRAGHPARRGVWLAAYRSGLGVPQSPRRGTLGAEGIGGSRLRNGCYRDGSAG